MRNVGTLSLDGVALRDNHAGFGGGGIRNDFKLTVDQSEISGNRTDNPSGDGSPVGVGGGGGVFNNDTANVVNSTISDNTSGTFGGGLTNFGTGAKFDAQHVTFNGNSAPDGGNIANVPEPVSTAARTTQETPGSALGTVTLARTVVANPRQDSNCSNPVDSNGFNLQFPDTSCGLEITGDPRLGPLADNGGPTNTNAELKGSASVDRVPSSACPPPDVDQRGVSRPQGPRCDIGAFETTPPPPPKPALRCTQTGTRGNDIIRGTAGDDVICGGPGNDIIYGLGGNDTLLGQDGKDVLRGGDGNDRLDGGRGDDQLVGEDGDDRLNGGSGRDDLTGQHGRDSLDSRDGVRGNDVDNGGPGADSCSADPRDVRNSC